MLEQEKREVSTGCKSKRELRLEFPRETGTNPRQTIRAVCSPDGALNQRPYLGHDVNSRAWAETR